MRVIVDPGHGGRDAGATVPAPGGTVLEKDLVMPYSRRLAQVLRGRGHEVRMTRDGDTYPSLQDRVRQANTWPADVFISMHANASSRAAANGMWVLHDDDSQPHSGPALARAVFRAMARVPGLADADAEEEVYPDRTGWTGGRELYVLGATRMPAVLVELGFMTNPDDLAHLLAPDTAQEVALAIADGLEAWADPTPTVAPVDEDGPLGLPVDLSVPGTVLAVVRQRPAVGALAVAQPSDTLLDTVERVLYALLDEPRVGGKLPTWAVPALRYLLAKLFEMARQ